MTTKYEDLLKLLTDFGKHMVKTKGDVQPMVVGVKPDGKQIALPVVHETDEQKAKMLKVIKETFKKEGVTMYGVLMEAWFLKGDKDDTPEKLGRPSKSPDRQEAVVTLVCNKDGCQGSNMLEIHRTRDGRAFLGVKNLFEGEDQGGGTFTELLQ